MSGIPIEDHAFLSDCSSAALITRHGSVDWLCLPRFDSPAVFGRLVDDGAGYFLLRPVDEQARVQRRYLSQSLVLETVWTCASGRVVVRDALALGRRERGHDLGLAAPGVLLRHAVCLDGDVDMLAEWEIRGPARRYLHSALLCWVALDRGIRLAGPIGATDRVPRWSETREQIRRTIFTDGWNDAVGAFTQTLGGHDLDASCLLMAVTGILPADDPRLHSTIDTIIANLSDDHGLLYRYRKDDGLIGDEGTFLLCTFWLVEALAATGRTTEAEQVLHRAASFANDLGLLAEQVDRDGGGLLGNFPQAFSHLGLILASQALAVATNASIDTRGES